MSLLLTPLPTAGHTQRLVALMNISLFDACCYSFQPSTQMPAERQAEAFSLKA